MFITIKYLFLFLQENAFLTSKAPHQLPVTDSELRFDGIFNMTDSLKIDIKLKKNYFDCFK